MLWSLLLETIIAQSPTPQPPKIQKIHRGKNARFKTAEAFAATLASTSGPAESWKAVTDDSGARKTTPIFRRAQPATLQQKNFWQSLTASPGTSDAGQTCSESLSDHVSGEFVKMHQLLNDRELGIKQALENQREKNLAQMETKLKELDWKMASRSETLCRIQASLECKDHISFLKKMGRGPAVKTQMSVRMKLMKTLMRGSGGIRRRGRRGGRKKKRRRKKNKRQQRKKKRRRKRMKMGPCNHHFGLQLSSSQLGPRGRSHRGKVQSWPAVLATKLERFTSTPCVVGRKGITTGRFYWEIQVGDSPGWIVGTAKKSVKRKKRLNFLPKEGVWAIELKAESTKL
ncbi:hypothetical protein E2320_014646 [Naja naja]|nr:hypothetical protein E2320_014646 [Naja naja]